MAEKIVIIVCGFAGSGKSTLAENLAKFFNLKCVHASDVLKQLLEKDVESIDLDKTKGGTGWWESEAGKKFMKQRITDGTLDKILDKKLLEIIEKGNVVLDSWTMPWLSEKGYKIWLETSIEERAKRVSERDKLPFEEVRKKIASRDIETARIYEKLYGFKMGKDLTPFNFIIKSDNLSIEQVFEKAKKTIEKELKKPNKQG